MCVCMCTGMLYPMIGDGVPQDWSHWACHEPQIKDSIAYRARDAGVSPAEYMYDISLQPGASRQIALHCFRVTLPAEPKLVVQRSSACPVDHSAISNCIGSAFPNSAVLLTGVHPALLSACRHTCTPSAQPGAEICAQPLVASHSALHAARPDHGDWA